jgi:hypothetical protein
VCGEYIYDGDWVYRVLGTTICERCIEDMKEIAEVIV